MPSTSHSDKALETLRQMNCDTNGWKTPDIRWVKVRRMVPTRVRCTTCSGTGQVADPQGVAEGRRRARTRCPDCTPRRNWPNYGTGEVVSLVEREVEVGEIQWPQGTAFDSRFGDGQHCALCAKRITSPSSWRPVLGYDRDGKPHGMWVGDECNRKILRVAERGISMDAATMEAADARATARVWREVPKAPREKKPPKPELLNPASKEELDAAVRATVGERFHASYYWLTRAALEYSFHVTSSRTGEIELFELKLTARHGVTVRRGFVSGKPLLKRPESQDALAVLRDALPTIHAALEPEQRVDRPAPRPFGKR